MRKHHFPQNDIQKDFTKRKTGGHCQFAPGVCGTMDRDGPIQKGPNDSRKQKKFSWSEHESVKSVAGNARQKKRRRSTPRGAHTCKSMEHGECAAQKRPSKTVIHLTNPHVIERKGKKIQA